VATEPLVLLIQALQKESSFLIGWFLLLAGVAAVFWTPWYANEMYRRGERSLYVSKADPEYVAQLRRERIGSPVAVLVIFLISGAICVFLDFSGMFALAKLYSGGKCHFVEGVVSRFERGSERRRSGHVETVSFVVGRHPIQFQSVGSGFRATGDRRIHNGAHIRLWINPTQHYGFTEAARVDVALSSADHSAEPGAVR
jgi:hypothetical protein